MLTFQWGRLNEIEGSCNAWDIFTDIAEHVFSKGQHELKTLNVFFESAFEDLSFHSFLKASD